MLLTLHSSDQKAAAATSGGELEGIKEESTQDDEEEEGGDERGADSEREVGSGRDSRQSVPSVPVITSEQYNQYVRSLIKLVVGESTALEWVKRGVLSENKQMYNYVFVKILL